jgi:hypothetical protein
MPVTSFTPRLILRVVWHNEFSAGADFARHIYSRFCRNVERPASRGMGIPVYFHSGVTPVEAGLPGVLAVTAADSTVVVSLLDTSIRGSQPWRDAIRQIEQQLSGEKCHVFLPVACEDKTVSIVERANCVRLYNDAPGDQPDKLVSAITHELARLLLAKGGEVQTQDFGVLEKSFAPVKLFISHSKHGHEGEVIATEVRDFGRQHLPVSTFFDSNDIAAGHNFEKEIRANVADSAMVVIHSDTYSDRSWCRKEVLFAKQYGCPVLSVNAITTGEERVFPYLGNVPAVRWAFDSPRRCAFVIDAALREVLRNVYFREQVKNLKRAGFVPGGCVEIGTAPEMLTYRNLVKAKRCDRATPSVLLYPDPPLGDEEIEILEDINPANLTLATPTGMAVQPDPTKSPVPFKGHLVGVSISNAADLAVLGMSAVHLEDAMVECARHVLAQGASLAYGGDLRPGGFTTILFELVRSHNRAGTEERVHNFLAWPIHLQADRAIRHEYLDEIHSHNVPPPADLSVDDKVYVAPDEPAGRYAWARSLTAMRQEMNEKISARVLLGGQVTGFKGKYPGLLEEALVALRTNKPLYLIGGFGGCTSAIVDALKGNAPEVFTEAFQAVSPLFAPLATRYQADADYGKTSPIDYSAELRFLQATGVNGLNNGLTHDENEILFTSRNLPEVVYLLLKGLSVRLT